MMPRNQAYVVLNPREIWPRGGSQTSSRTLDQSSILLIASAVAVGRSSAIPLVVRSTGTRLAGKCNGCCVQRHRLHSMSLLGTFTAVGLWRFLRTTARLKQSNRDFVRDSSQTVVATIITLQLIDAIITDRSRPPAKLHERSTYYVVRMEY
jgi:hypothetical protein